MACASPYSCATENVPLTRWHSMPSRSKLDLVHQQAPVRIDFENLHRSPCRLTFRGALPIGACTHQPQKPDAVLHTAKSNRPSPVPHHTTTATFPLARVSVEQTFCLTTRHIPGQRISQRFSVSALFVENT